MTHVTIKEVDRIHVIREIYSSRYEVMFSKENARIFTAGESHRMASASMREGKRDCRHKIRTIDSSMKNVVEKYKVRYLAASL